MTEESRYWSPSRTFELILKIGKLDLTPDLIEFSIITSIDLPYQTFSLRFFLDPDTMIAEKIYGQTPINVTVNLLATEQYPLETTKFELMYLASDMQLGEDTQQPDVTQRTRVPVTINAVSRDAYTSMNTFVNSIHQATTVKTAIESLVGETGASVKYDTSGQNPETIDQILVPPSTLYKNLHYINRTFGIFDGLPAFYCDYDNIVHIKNLTNKMRQAQALTIYQLAMDADNTAIFDKCNDGKHFYTMRPVTTAYEGNSVFAYLAPQMIYVVKPGDRLEQRLTIDLLDFTKNYGLISKNDEIYFDKSAITTDKRKTVHKDHTGYETTETFIHSNDSKKISGITDVTIVVEQSIKILNLMAVGESVELTYPSVESSQIAGRYILKTSEIKFNKIKDWETSAVLSLIRSNRTLT